MSSYDNIYGRSVYAIGAYDGLWIGLMMGACVVCMVTSAHAPVLSLVGLALFFITPFAAWKFLRRGWVSGAVPPTFSAVWLHGICIFLFGSIIMALMMYFSLKILSPNWIENQTVLAAQQLCSDPRTAEEGHTLLRIIESGQLPSAIYTSVSSIWLVAFTGSIWSMIFALILTRTKHYIKMRSNYIANNIINE